MFDERADKIAKHVAKHPEAADTGLKVAAHEDYPFHNIIWLATSTDGPITQCPFIDNGRKEKRRLR